MDPDLDRWLELVDERCRAMAGRKNRWSGVAESAAYLAWCVRRKRSMTDEDMRAAERLIGEAENLHVCGQWERRLQRWRWFLHARRVRGLAG